VQQLNINLHLEQNIQNIFFVDFSSFSELYERLKSYTRLRDKRYTPEEWVNVPGSSPPNCNSFLVAWSRLTVYVNQTYDELRRKIASPPRHGF